MKVIFNICLFAFLSNSLMPQEPMTEWEGQFPFLKTIDEPPLFPGCEDFSLSKQDLKNCSDKMMLEFVYGRVKYPSKARKKGIEGTVYVKFVLEKDGEITNIEIVRDIGAGCGKEVERVVNLMPNWIPGKDKGKPVRVQFNLPVNFKLE
jgi:protein TonB